MQTRLTAALFLVTVALACDPDAGDAPQFRDFVPHHAVLTSSDSGAETTTGDDWTTGGSASETGASVDEYIESLVPAPGEQWSFEEPEPGAYYPGWPMPEEDPLFKSVPALLGTTQTCVEKLAVPLAGPLLPKGICDNVGDIECIWVTACGYHYGDIAGCDGDCILNDKIRAVTKKQWLISSAPFPVTACAIAMASGAADAACLYHFGPGPLACGPGWPAPKPTTVCK